MRDNCPPVSWIDRMAKPRIVQGEVRGVITLSSSVSLSVRTSLVWQWAEIAVRHESEAQEARGQGEINNTELQASMVCATATASALDAIYAEVRDVVPAIEREKWRDNGTARWKQVYETLRRAFKLPLSLRTEMKWLFEREELGRDFLVHPDAEFRDAADHPLLPNTTAERAALRAENATRAVDLLLAVLDASLTSANLEWASQNDGVITQLRGLRVELVGA